MKQLFIGGVALAALSTAAVAVEIAPTFEALPPAEAAPYNWTGLYGRLNTFAPYDSLLFGAPSTGTSAPDSFVGSGQFGYNYQIGPVVLGVESDITRRLAPNFSSFPGANRLDSINLQADHGWIGTIRPRAGLAADNWLFYGTGGLAYGANGSDGRSGAARSGWVAGGGVEFAGGKAWSLGLEYLYADFGKSAQGAAGQIPGATPFSPLGTEDRSQMVRGRLNYRFGWDGLSK